MTDIDPDTLLRRKPLSEALTAARRSNRNCNARYEGIPRGRRPLPVARQDAAVPLGRRPRLDTQPTGPAAAIPSDGFSGGARLDTPAGANMAAWPSVNLSEPVATPQPDGSSPRTPAGQRMRLHPRQPTHFKTAAA
jgi:hypothetical protein